MHTQTFHRSAIHLGAVLATLFCSLALADDTEIFFNNLNNGANANIMFILDSSGSMTDVVTTQHPYHSTNTYSQNTCGTGFSSSNVYYGTGGKVPACGTTNSIPLSNFKCVDAAKALATGAGTATPGFYSGNLIQWGPFTITTGKGKNKVTTTVYEWQGTLGIASGTSVECKNDAGVAGNGVTGGSTLYPSKISDPSNTVGLWDVAGNSWWNVSGNVGTSYVIYSANYLNYYYNSGTTTSNTKVEVLQQGIKSILNSVSNVNVGLMRYDALGHGGMVMEPILPLNPTNKTAILATVNSDAPAGTTPISESLYEAYLYFSGGGVNFGNTSWNYACTNWQTQSGLLTCTAATLSAYPSVASSRKPATITGANYASPASTSCQKNYVVFLTDGLPNNDKKADGLIKGLPNFSTTGGACYTSTSAMYTALGTSVPTTGTDGSGWCSAAIAKYMHGNDLYPTVKGMQNVTSYFIGFGNDFADTSGAPTAAFAYLQDVASKGGGQAYTATSLTDLTAAFNQILSTVVTTNTMFSAPAVAVNAFNRTQTLNDLYVSVFSPQSTYHWPGNVKKYKVVNNQVVDATGAAAVDPGTGFFLSTAQSYWSPGVDGFDVTLGGAAANLPNYASRNVYTYIGANPAGTGASLSAFNVGNSALTATNLHIGGTNDPALTDLINWARGQDILDDNKNGSTTDMRHDMGDPIHTAPALAIYGKNSDGTNNIAAFVPTNDGYLHAVDANTGVELWTFIPQEMFPHLVDLYNDAATTTKHYGIDGAITVLSYDINGDGTIDSAAGDRVILYFGTGRNTDTSTYYAMDVTNKNAPLLLWSISDTNQLGSPLPGIGQAWSQPQITRVNISGATQNSQKLVLVIGGGYDTSEDGYTYVPHDVVGNHIFMIDALKGTLLWDAGNGPISVPSGSTTFSFNNSSMDHAIPSGVAVIDFNGDGYADRMYVGDMAGQLWRFDITNGQPASSLVTGGVIASLGTHEDTTPIQTRTRRFYNMPDVASVNQPGDAGYLNIAIGSGYRGHPLDQPPPPTSGTPPTYQAAQDRFYSVRDIISPFGTLPQTDFNDRTKVPLIRDAEVTTSTASLVDITSTVTPTIPPGSHGWQLDMNQYGLSANQGWDGEKILSSSTTFNNSIIFTTYTPSSTVVTDPCTGVGAGTNRVYQVSVFNGSPTQTPSSGVAATTADRAKDLAQSGIAPQVTMLFLPDATNASNPNKTDIVLMSGAETVGVLTLNSRQKTYWRDGSAN